MRPRAGEVVSLVKCLGCKSKDPRLTTESLEESGSMPHVCDPCTGSEMDSQHCPASELWFTERAHLGRENKAGAIEETPVPPCADGRTYMQHTDQTPKASIKCSGACCSPSMQEVEAGGLLIFELGFGCILRLTKQPSVHSCSTHC